MNKAGMASPSIIPPKQLPESILVPAWMSEQWTRHMYMANESWWLSFWPYVETVASANGISRLIDEWAVVLFPDAEMTCLSRIPKRKLFSTLRGAFESSGDQIIYGWWAASSTMKSYSLRLIFSQTCLRVLSLVYLCSPMKMWGHAEGKHIRSLPL